MSDRTPELSLLRMAAPQVAEIDEPAMHRARLRLGSLIDLEQGRSLAARRRPLRFTLAAAVAASLVAILLVAQTILPSERGGPSSASALDRLAIVAATADPGAGSLPTGSFAYQRTSVSRQDARPGESGTWIMLVEETVETWVAADGAGRMLVSNRSARPLTDEDAVLWREAGSPSLGSERDDRFPTGELPFFDLSGVPNEEDALLTAIRESPELGMPRGPLDLLDSIADLLRRPYAPPAYRATLFRVVAGIDGVDATSDGEEVLVSVEDVDRRLELLFDADTSELLVERTLTLLPDGSEQLFQEIRYLESGIVGSVEERP